MSIHRDPVTHFTPSSTNIMSQVEAAMAKFDAAREQAALKVEAKANDRAAAMWAAEESAKAHARKWRY